MLWLRLPWSAFSVVRGYAPADVVVFLRMDIPELIAMGDRRDMLEYGRRFSPMQSRAEQGMVAIKWPVSLVSLSDFVGEGYLYDILQAGGYEIETYRVGDRTFRAYDFPVAIDDFLMGAEIEDNLLPDATQATIAAATEAALEETPLEEGSPPPGWMRMPPTYGWCEAYLDMEGEIRWRWGAEYPQNVYPLEGFSNDFLEFMQEQTPFVGDEALLKLLGLKDWPAGDERWVRMHEPE